MIYTVDAHAFIWLVVGSPRLGLNAKAVMNDSTSQLILPATAYAEACWIVQHGRIPGVGVADMQASLAADTRFSVYPLNRAVIDRSQGLDAIHEMHDRQIVATTLVLADSGASVALLTHDANITASGLVPVVW